MKNAKCKLQIANWGRGRRGFTLMELLIVMLIITILAALSMVALQGAVEEARADRTRAIIAKLDQLIMDRYEGYRTRTLPIRVMPGTRPKSEPFTDAAPFNGFWNVGETYTDSNGSGNYNYGAAFFRLMALREMMRMELPDRRTDVVDYVSSTPDCPMETTATGMTITALQRTYYRKALQATGGNPSNTTTLVNWTNQYQGSECLYLIVSAMHDGDKNALDFFTPSEIGDVDQDGMLEILDGWGQPILFLRWAPAYIVENGVLTQQTNLYVNGIAAAPDPYDPVREDARFTYALRPLIYSAGRDKGYDVAGTAVDTAGNDFRYSQNLNNPYYLPTIPGQVPFGSIGDPDGNGYPEWADNITNHYQPTN